MKEILLTSSVLILALLALIPALAHGHCGGCAALQTGCRHGGCCH